MAPPKPSDTREQGINIPFEAQKNDLETIFMQILEALKDEIKNP